jgi:putative oxidoreductase
MLTEIGIARPEIMAYLVGAFEVVGGLLLVVGGLVRLVAVIGVIEMIVAALAVHWASGFSFMNITGTTQEGAAEFGMPGYEINLLYIAGLVSLLISGPGALALGNFTRKSTAGFVTRDEPVVVGNTETGWTPLPPRSRKTPVTIDRH